MNFQRTRFSPKGLQPEIGLSDLAFKVLTYWNSKEIKKHLIKKSKILTRFGEIVDLGVNVCPDYFALIKMKSAIDLYDKHVHLAYSKLSKIPVISIDDFFQFSAFRLQQISMDKKQLGIFGDIKSLFIDLLNNEQKYFYEGKKADIDFIKMVEAILNQCKGQKFQDENSERLAAVKLMGCYNDNISKLILCDGIITSYEVANKELFQNKESFYNWFFKFLVEKNSLQIGKFQIKYLSSNFLYTDFINFMENSGRYL